MWICWLSFFLVFFTFQRKATYKNLCKKKHCGISKFKRLEGKTVAGKAKRKDGAIGQSHIFSFIIIITINIILIIIMMMQVKRRGKMARSPGPTFSRKINFFSEKVQQQLFKTLCTRSFGDFMFLIFYFVLPGTAVTSPPLSLLSFTQVSHLKSTEFIVWSVYHSPSFSDR